MRILLATDGSRHSLGAADLLARLSFRDPVQVTVVTIVDTAELPGDIGTAPGALARLKEAIRNEGKQLLLAASDRLGASGWRVTTVVREGHAAEQICDLARELAADLVVVGSRGLGGLSRYLLGSVSYRVLKHAPCSVLLARFPSESDEDSDGSARGSARDAVNQIRVVVGFDGSSLARSALSLLLESGMARSCHIRLVQAFPLVTHYRLDILQTMGELWAQDKAKAEQEFAKIEARFRGTALSVSSELREGPDIASEILAVTREFDADLLIVGSKGRSAIGKFLLGSVSSKLAHHARCSVLVVKGGHGDSGT